MRPSALLWALGLLLQAKDSVELISPNFADCIDQFHNSRVPALTTTYKDQHEGHREDPIDICQKYGNKIYYATRYDKKRRTPIFSAYFEERNTVSQTGGRPRDVWKYEPGLFALPGGVKINDGQRRGTLLNTADPVHMENMQNVWWNDQNARDTLGENMPMIGQKERPSYHYKIDPNMYSGPIREGYEPNTHDIGHIIPSSWGTDEAMRKATCAVTNSAPQDACLNRNLWSEAEADAKEYMKDHCSDDRKYFIVGTALKKVNPQTQRPTLPPKWALQPDDKGKITIPDWFWAVACCEKQTDSFGFGYFSTSNDKYADVEFAKIEDIEKRLKDQDHSTYHFTDEETGSLFGPSSSCYNVDANIDEWLETKSAGKKLKELYPDDMTATLEEWALTGKYQIVELKAPSDQPRASPVPSSGSGPRSSSSSSSGSSPSPSPDGDTTMTDSFRRCLKRHLSSSSTSSPAKKPTRKKRSTTEEKEFQVATFIIEDLNEDSTFSIESVSFTEKYANETVVENHTFDLVNNVLIEDVKDGGSKLEAKLWENSEEKESTIREDKTTYISIELKPRN